MYSEIDDMESNGIDLKNQPQFSIKSFLFPQSETLSSYIVDTGSESGRMEYSFHPLLPENEPTVFFGVRSCDMFGVMYCDMVFLHENPRDVYYEQRRNNSIFISLGCNEPFANCFCNATHTGPFLDAGFDLQLTDLGDCWFVETGRPRGAKLTEDFSIFFTQASEEDKKAQFQVALEARGMFTRPVHIDLAVKLLSKSEVPDSIIQDLSSRCQDCGGCAYICPTCTCFNITDLQLSIDSGERIRSWDACTFAGFSTMAGGHNPVQPRTGRIRRRFLHKLLYDVKKHGRTSCVGCGRCVGMCFGGVDIVHFIDLLTAAGENRKGSDP
jgi:ferredoxin